MAKKNLTDRQEQALGALCLQGPSNCCSMKSPLPSAGAPLPTLVLSFACCLQSVPLLLLMLPFHEALSSRKEAL